MVFMFAAFGGMTWTLTIFKQSFSIFELKKHPEVLHSNCDITNSFFEHFIHFWWIFLILMQNLVKMYWSFQLTIGNSRITLNTRTTVNILWEAVQRVMGANLLDLEGVSTMAPSGRKLVGCQQLPAIKCYQGPWTRREFFENVSKRKWTWDIGTWNMRSPYVSGSLKTIARKLAKWNLNLVGVEEVR
jgi:hypothetical protein